MLNLKKCFLTILIFSLTFWGCEETEEEEPNPMEGYWELIEIGLYENNDCSGVIDYDTTFYSYQVAPVYMALEISKIYFEDESSLFSCMGYTDPNTGNYVSDHQEGCGEVETNIDGAKKLGRYYPGAGVLMIDNEYTFYYEVRTDLTHMDLWREREEDKRVQKTNPNTNHI